MSRITRYHLGGYDPAAPQQNRAEVVDGATGTYTAWDPSGTQTAQRPLTADETAQIAAQDAVTAVDTNRGTLQQQAGQALANLRTIRDAPQVTVTSLAQAQTVCRQLQSAVQVESAVLIRIARLLLNQLDAAD